MALPLGGLLIGLMLGAIVFRTNFCAMGSISDMVSFGDYRRFRAWILASAVAIIGTQWLSHAGVVDLSKSMYLAPNLNWLGNILGGALFGFGMVFGGGCATRNLARIGGGDLRSLLTVIVLGIAAYVAMTGILGPGRAALEQATSVALKAPSQSLVDIVAGAFNARSGATQMGVTATVLGLMLAYCFADARFRGSPLHVASGIGVGMCIVAGWALTGLTFDELADRPMAPVSLTFVRPSGDTLEWLQRSTALGLPGFGVASVFGTILGAFLTAKATGKFRITTFSDTGDTTRHLGGAVLMGIGGIMALGCTIGQGITGMSTLATGSFLTFAGLIVGGIIGIRTLEALLMREA
ncbi:MAG: YeeE/YedE family protein [Hyphomicrobiaceae bacterium]